jgi:hypothetical protein
VTSEPVLAQPQLDQQFEVEVDASGFAFRAVLSQRGEDGKKHPITFYSATAIEAEQNYDIYDLELLAIVKACRHWRPYLAGSPHKVIIYTDHANLQYWREPHKISRRIAREVLELSEFNIELCHIPGKSNGRADALSRRPVTVSPSPQSQIEAEERLHVLREYAHDFRCRHTKDTQDFDWDPDDEDHGLAIGRLVVT